MSVSYRRTARRCFAKNRRYKEAIYMDWSSRFHIEVNNLGGRTLRCSILGSVCRFYSPEEGALLPRDSDRRSPPPFMKGQVPIEQRIEEMYTPEKFKSY